METTSKKKQKFCKLTGFSKATTHDKIKKDFNRVPVKGDWRRFRIIEDVMYKTASITWKKCSGVQNETGDQSSSSDDSENSSPLLVVNGPVPTGMEDMISASAKTYCCNFDSLPSYVVEHFGVTKQTFSKNMFDVKVSFSNAETKGSFW